MRIALGSRLTITPGGRVDHWSLTSETTGAPWINAELRLSERTRLRGGSGVYRQFPTLDEVHGFQGGCRTLRPQRALHLDAGIEQFQTACSTHLESGQSEWREQLVLQGEARRILMCACTALWRSRSASTSGIT